MTIIAPPFGAHECVGCRLPRPLAWAEGLRAVGAKSAAQRAEIPVHFTRFEMSNLQATPLGCVSRKENELSQ